MVCVGRRRDSVDYPAKVAVNAFKECEPAGPGRRSGGRSVRQREYRGFSGGAIQDGLAMRDGYAMLAMGSDSGEHRGRRDVQRRHGNVA